MQKPTIEQRFAADYGLPTPAEDTLPDPDILVHEQPDELELVDDAPAERPRLGGAPAEAVLESQEMGAPTPAERPLEIIEHEPQVDDTSLLPNPLTMLATALESGVDVSKLERLFDLAERHEREIQRKAFARALSDFQGDCPEIVDNRTAYVNTKDGGSYSYSYADLDQIMRTIRPTLKACGLSVTYDTEIAEDGNSIKSLCYVMHQDGHEIVRTFVSPVDNLAKMNDSQKMGSANAYASRYNVVNALGLTTGEDDDGAAGERARGAPEPAKAADTDEFFPVGKHKGDRWDAVPLDYLEWVVANMTNKPDIVKRAKEQIDARLDSDNIPDDDDAELSMAECARGITQAKTPDELADIWTLVPDKHRDGLAAYHATRQNELNQ